MLLYSHLFNPANLQMSSKQVIIISPQNTLAHLSGVMDGSDQESMGSRPLSPNWEEEPIDSGSESKTPTGRSKGGGGKMCKRRGRCMECPNCLKKDDCGQCPNCL